MLFPLLLLVGLGGLLYAGVLADVVKKLPGHVGPAPGGATTAGVGACCGAVGGYDPDLAHVVLRKLGTAGFAPPDPSDPSLVEVVEGVPATPLASALGWAWGMAEAHDVGALVGDGQEPLFLRASMPGANDFPDGYALVLLARTSAVPGARYQVPGQSPAPPLSLLHRALAEVPAPLRRGLLELALDPELAVAAEVLLAFAARLDAAGAPAAAAIARTAAAVKTTADRRPPTAGATADRRPPTADPLSPASLSPTQSPTCDVAVAAVRGLR